MSCREFEKKDLAFGALCALDGEQSARLRRHVQTCAACAARLRQYESLCVAQASAADELSHLPLPMTRMTFTESRHASTLRQLARWVMPAAGLGAAAVVALLLMILPPKPARITRPAQTIVLSEPSPEKPMAVATLAGYRHALGQGGAESLDSVLERDADLLLTPTSAGETVSFRDELF